MNGSKLDDFGRGAQGGSIGIAMVRFYFCAAALIAVTSGCATAVLPAEPMIRLHNASPHILDSVSVSFMGSIVAYGRLGPGERSQYRAARGAYRYAYIEARVNGERFRLQPIDYVGETPLEPGNYTYRLSLDTAQHSIGLELERND